MTVVVGDVGAHGLATTRRCWSTEDVRPRDALAYWCDSISQVMLELDIEATGADFFSAQLDQFSLGPAKANFLRATPQSVARTRRRISRSNNEAFLLLHLREGEFELDHYGQTSLLRGGDCVLVDAREPYRARCPRVTRCMVLQLPLQWLRAWLPQPEVMAGRVLHPDNGWSAALSAALAALHPDGFERSGAASGRGSRADRVVVGLGGRPDYSALLTARAAGRAVVTVVARPVPRDRPDTDGRCERPRYLRSLSAPSLRETGYDVWS